MPVRIRELLELDSKSKALETHIEQGLSHGGMTRMTRDGHELWRMIQDLIRDCEAGMWDHLRTNRLGKSWFDERAGIAFIESLLHQEHDWKRTKSLMTEIRLWAARVQMEVRCEETLRLSISFSPTYTAQHRPTVDGWFDVTPKRSIPRPEIGNSWRTTSLVQEEVASDLNAIAATYS